MLPTSKNTTYISGVTPVKGNDMNDLQDQAIAINNLVTGQPQANWTNVALAGNLTVGGQLFSFNDFTFTADSTTDQLAATGHPLQTGDGPLRNTNSGGSPPGNLPLATDWYAIFVDANHVKAATTRANALAGIAIDISSNGTGTQTVAHQAGTTRVSDVEVTRNLIADGLITANAGVTAAANQHVTVSGTGRVRHGDYPLVLSAFMGQASSGWTFGVSGVGAQPNATCGVAGTLLGVWIPLHEGETISSVSFRALGNGTTSTLVCKVQVIDGSDVVTTIGTRTLAAGIPTSYANYAVTGLTPTAIPAGGGAWIQFDTGSTTGQSITRIVVNEAQS